MARIVSSDGVKTYVKISSVDRTINVVRNVRAIDHVTQGLGRRDVDVSC